MRSTGIRVLAALAFLLLATGAAQEGSSRERIRALMEVTGTTQSVRAIPAMAGQQAAAFGSDELGQAFQDAFVSSFAPEPILDGIEQELASHYDPAHAAALLAWYESPLGERLRASLESLNTAAGQAALAAYAEGLQTDPPSRERVALAAEIDAATQASTMNTELVIAMSRNMAIAVAGAIAPDDPASGGITDDEIDAMRQQFAPLMRAQMIVTLLFAVRNFTDAETVSYLEVSRSAPSQWFNDHSFTGLLDGVTNSSRRFGETLARTFAAMVDKEDMERLKSEARAYGAGREDRECVGESLRRDASCSGFGCRVQNASFLRACLDASTKRTDVCAGAPELDETIFWRLQQCDSLGRDDPFCRSLMSSLQRYCVESRETVGA